MAHKSITSVPSWQRLLAARGVPLPEPEFRFAPPRRWRFDWCWSAHKLALEIEGGVWTRGRHTRGKGFLGDMEKYNAAVLHGWRVLRCTPDMLHTGETVELVLRAFGLMEELHK